MNVVAKRIRSLIGLLVYLLPAGLFVWLVMGSHGEFWTDLNRRFALFAFLALVGTAVLKLTFPGFRWLTAALGTALAYGSIYQAATFLPEVSTYPFSLAWSEASRYYYASLFFARQIYGISVPPSVLHPTRYLMQAVPFLIPHAPLWLHRLWQVLLWLGFSSWTGLALARRLKTSWIFVLWVFLSLFLGPVYYHLLVMVILVLYGFDRGRPWRSLGVVLLASVWAGISRINWFPIPGMLAAALYFLEEPVASRPAWRYLLPPAAWTILGTGTAFLTQRLYIILSGNPPEMFGSSFTSNLLWYRLWPNVTYPNGIVRSVLYVSLPTLLIILARWAPHWRQYHWVRVLGLGAMGGVLLAGGLVVSVKIGGGSNLHNLDAYLVLLFLTGAYLYYGRFTPERDALPADLHSLWPLATFAALLPVYYVLINGGPLPVRDFPAAYHDLQELQQRVQSVANQGGPVLFIYQRHLLTMHMIEGVPLVMEDEIVFLMEMVMANNKPYLYDFYDQLKNHRYAMIVTGPMIPHYQDHTYEFSEENNAWVDRIVVPVLCYYEQEALLPDVNLQLLVPRDEPCNWSPK